VAQEGLQNKLYAKILPKESYAARVHDFRTYHSISKVSLIASPLALRKTSILAMDLAKWLQTLLN